ncbi:von Willebrand factor type A domain protein [Gemmata sp. SH-PL17]|uniref:VWA domain-containing protein n=1 Tax=Gemmata sp. SH-PL17 TaxID=1630693 RepID=UPI00078EC38F|nr:VWA domain-containing protein [Gemmata sp. SH-PL17]AMV26563.1 von Willebrand factor type A domain protein [Gemmata sp. SH-PL17]
MTLLEPLWLLLAVPLLAALLRYPLPGRLLNALRVATVLFTVFALAGLALRFPSRAGTVVVVTDRSRSMPAGSDADHKELIDLLHSAMGSSDRLAVVSFGETVAVERAPGGDKFSGFTHEIGADGSNLGEGIDAALSLVPKDAPGRILVLSDGRWTGRDPAALAGLAADRRIAVDYRHRSRPTAGDLAVARVDAPTAVAPGEGFLITAWVQSPVEDTIRFEVTRGDKVIASGEQRVTAGLNRLTFRDRAAEPGSQNYRVRVRTAADDPVPENNTARVLVGVNGPRPILHLTPTASSGLTALLKGGGLDVRAMPADRFNFTLEELSGYSAVILENVPAEKIGTRNMETLASWVRASGSGLMVTGGKQSYGPGGYYKSPLEPIMPVSMELRQEHRKLALAIVVALDRSGSMALPAGGGRVKMDLANLGAAQVLDMLGPLDEFGCFAVDTSAHEIAELGLVKDKDRIRDKILRIQSSGGGIYVDEALTASADMIRHAKAGTKHIVLFADAADAEQPGNYKELLANTRKAGITVSVIGLGKNTDKDAALLEDVAKRGGGRIFITDSPEELPRLFAQDTFVVARNSFLEDPVRVQATAGLTALAGRSFALDRSIGGYNLCYLRPEATLGVVSRDEYKAPVVASWQAGSGRVLCYTGEADGKFAGAFAKSPETGEFYASLARWTAGQSGSLAEGIAVTQEVRNGVNRIQLHLDPERKAEPFAGVPQLRTLRARPGEAPRTETVPLVWAGPDTLVADVSLEGEETALSTVSIPGQKAQSLPPVCLPFSPEYAPAPLGASDDRGRATLERLARSTGGVERIDLSGVWKDLPRRPRSFPLAPWFLLTAVVCLLLEVLERRTGLVTSATAAIRPKSFRFRFKRKVVIPAHVAAPSEPVTTKKAAAPVAAPEQPKVAAPTEAKGGLLDAMRQVRDRKRGDG